MNPRQSRRAHQCIHPIGEGETCKQETLKERPNGFLCWEHDALVFPRSGTRSHNKPTKRTQSRWDEVFDRHRGPFTLIAYGPVEFKRGKIHQDSAVVGKELRKAQEIVDLACMILLDPRDIWESIFVWSETERQWVTAFRRGIECVSSELGDIPQADDGGVARGATRSSKTQTKPQAHKTKQRKGSKV